MLRIVALAARDLDAEVSSLHAKLSQAGYSPKIISQAAKHPSAGCWTCELAIEGLEPAPLRAISAQWVDELGIDIAILPATTLPFHPRLAVFDMDSTLIQMEVIDELAKLAGVGGEVSAITAAAMQGEIDFRESFRRRVGLLVGLKRELVDTLVPWIPITSGAKQLVSHLHGLGCHTCIISGGFDFVGAHLQRELGIREAFTNRLAFLSGQICGVEGEIVDAAAKARHFRQIAERDRIPREQTLAVGDGANDIPMLGLAGLSVGYRPKPILRAQAALSLLHIGLDGLIPLLTPR